MERRECRPQGVWEGDSCAAAAAAAALEVKSEQLRTGLADAQGSVATLLFLAHTDHNSSVLGLHL